MRLLALLSHPLSRFPRVSVMGLRWCGHASRRTRRRPWVQTWGHTRVQTRIHMLVHTVVLGGLLTLGACRSDEIGQPVAPDIQTLFWKLGVNHRAVILSVHAPYDTVQLRAVALNAYGDTLAGTDTLRIRRLVATDTALQVGADGLVTAKYPTATASKLEVSLTRAGLTRYDTVTVMVRAESPIRFLKSLTFRPRSTDSTWRWAGALGGFAYVPLVGFPQYVTVTDSSDQSIFVTQLALEYQVDNLEVVGGLSFVNPRVGESWIRAKTYAYGQEVSDSFLFRRVEPTVKFVVIYKTFPLGAAPRVQFYPSELRLRPGQTMIFINRFWIGTGQAPFGANVPTRVLFSESQLEYIDSVDIVFQEPSAAQAATSFGTLSGWRPAIANVPSPGFRADTSTGNIAAFGHIGCRRGAVISNGDRTCGGLATGTGAALFELDPGYRSRKFTVPGTYHYTSSRDPQAVGTIIVTD